MDLRSNSVTRTRFLSHHLWLCHPWGWLPSRRWGGPLWGCSVAAVQPLQHYLTPSSKSCGKRICNPDSWNQSFRIVLALNGPEWPRIPPRFGVLTDLGDQGWRLPPRPHGLQIVGSSMPVRELELMHEGEGMRMGEKSQMSATKMPSLKENN